MDKNHKLDGLELLSALIHTMHGHSDDHISETYTPEEKEVYLQHKQEQWNEAMQLHTGKVYKFYLL